MTAATLRNYTCKDLARMAEGTRCLGMARQRKDELVSSLSKLRDVSLYETSRAKRAPDDKTGGPAKATPGPPLEEPRTSPGQNRGSCASIQVERAENLLPTPRSGEFPGSTGRHGPRPLLAARVLELGQQSVERAGWRCPRPGMGQTWCDCMTSPTTGTPVCSGHRNLRRRSQLVRRCRVSSQSFRLEIGYRALDGSFYCLARSNTVTTPPAVTSDALDDNWVDVAENADRIYAMSGGY